MGSNLPDTEIVTEALLRFRDFLNASWSSMHETLRNQVWDDDPYIVEDWLDDNWKHLFVRQVLGKIDDLQPLSISINEIQRGRHRYQLQIDMPFKAVFVALGSKKDGFSIAPPFEQVQVLTAAGELEVIPLSSVKFTLIEK
ncbi:MAG: hypothetical protein ABW086_11405 [Sedimenticola sp.]